MAGGSPDGESGESDVFARPIDSIAGRDCDRSITADPSQSPSERGRRMAPRMHCPRMMHEPNAEERTMQPSILHANPWADRSQDDRDLVPSTTALHACLGTRATELGLTTAAIDTLVAQSQVTSWRPGQTIFRPGDGSDFVHFLIAGAAKMVCPTSRRQPITVRIMPPGDFLDLVAISRTRAQRPFGAVAHSPSLVALVRASTMLSVAITLPSESAWRLFQDRGASPLRLVHERCQLASLPVRDRVVRVLQSLARDFGHEAERGMLIDLPMVHADLAALAGVSRADVSRTMAALQRSGHIEVRHHRVYLRTPAPLRDH